VILIVQISLGLCWIWSGVSGYIFNHIDDFGSREKNLKRSHEEDLMLAQFMASGIVIISILQISNWFTLRHINKMLAVLFMA